MNIHLMFANTNWLVVMLAATLAFVIGGCWYSPALFGRFLPNLMSDVKADGDTSKGPTRHIVSIFAASFALPWLSAAFLAGLLEPQATARDGIYIGLAIALFFVIPAQSIAAMFGARPIQMVFINGGYFAVCLAVMGAILAVWG